MAWHLCASASSLVKWGDTHCFRLPDELDVYYFGKISFQYSRLGFVSKGVQRGTASPQLRATDLSGCTEPHERRCGGGQCLYSEPSGVKVEEPVEAELEGPLRSHRMSSTATCWASASALLCKASRTLGLPRLGGDH